MMRIGIIGTESSHAMAFANYFNLPDPETGAYRHKNMRVTALFGDVDSAKAVAKASGAEVVETIDGLLDAVDAVIITIRRGSEHKAAALRVIERGLPLFLDKPFTSSTKDAEDLATALKAHPCPITGGSGCKFSASIQTIKKAAKAAMAADTLCSGFLSFEIMMHSEYDGFWFYAPHLIEMCLEIFGNQITSVSAVKQGESLVATLQYPQVVVTLHFTPSKAEHRCLLITREGSQVYDLDISDCYSTEAEKFAQLLNGQWKGLTAGEMALPVYLIDAILQAADTGECIALNSE